MHNDTSMIDRGTVLSTLTGQPFQANSQELVQSMPAPLEPQNTACEADTAPLSSQTEPSSTQSKKEPRKRRSKAEQDALTDIVLRLLEKGHNTQAIALYVNESHTVVKNIRNDLMETGRYTFTAPVYSTIGGGHFIQSIKELSITKDDFVSIKRNANGELVISTFAPNELASDDC